MRGFAISIVFAASMVLTGMSHAQVAGTTDAKPLITLVVNLNRLTINRQNGNISFVIDAASSGNFTGTVSGTMSVCAPVNPSGVQLKEGVRGKTFPFKLTAAQSTSTKPAQTGTFTIRTSPDNPTSGTVVYVVTVDPSDQFTTANSPQIVKVITTP